MGLGPEVLVMRSGLTIRAAEGGKKKLARFEGVAYSGAAMRPIGFWGLIVVELAGITFRSQHRPALRNHDPLCIVGHTTEVRVSKSGLLVAGVLSGEKHHTDAVMVPAGQGFQFQLSIGADTLRTEYLEAGSQATVNGRTIKGPCTIARSADLKEVSFVALGADEDTSVSIAAASGGHARLEVSHDIRGASQFPLHAGRETWKGPNGKRYVLS